MLPQGNSRNNVDRFYGFQEGYDQNRPEAPPIVVELITHYLGKRPSLVMDVGCGTGLSSFIWMNQADRIIGVEPNSDMLSKAREKWSLAGEPSSLAFIQGYSNSLNIPSASADAITCSQSFHWMDPDSTLNEFSRVLKDGGVFAAYDCDWPPSASWVVEQNYLQVMEQADRIIAKRVNQEEQAVKLNKEEHLSRMRKSGVFRFTREIVFHNKESCTAERYIGLALSQGGVQTVFKRGSTELDATIESFKKSVDDYFQGRTLDVLFSYRMRLGIK